MLAGALDIVLDLLHALATGACIAGLPLLFVDGRRPLRLLYAAYAVLFVLISASD